MSRRMDWEKAASRDRVAPGITNTQAAFLAKLCRKLKMPYPGNGMTLAEASAAIDERLALVDKAQKKRRPNPARLSDPPRWPPSNPTTSGTTNAPDSKAVGGIQ